MNDRYVLRGGLLCAYAGEAISFAFGIPTHWDPLIFTAVYGYIIFAELKHKRSFWVSGSNSCRISPFSFCGGTVIYTMGLRLTNLLLPVLPIPGLFIRLC